MLSGNEVCRAEVLRQQGSVLIFGMGVRKSLEQVAQVAVGLQAIGLGRFDQGVQGGARPGTLGITGEEPVLPPHHKRADGILRQVVIRREIWRINVSVR